MLQRSFLGQHPVDLSPAGVFLGAFPGTLAILGPELQRVGSLGDVAQDVVQQVVAAVAALRVHGALKRLFQQLDQGGGVLLAGSASELHGVAALQLPVPADDMHVDRASFLELEPHAPMVDLFDAASLQGFTVLEDKLSKDGLEGVVEVQRQDQLLAGQSVSWIRGKHAFVQRELPFGRS